MQSVCAGACNAVKFKDPPHLTRSRRLMRECRFAEASRPLRQPSILPMMPISPSLKAPSRNIFGFYTQGKPYIDPAQGPKGIMYCLGRGSVDKIEYASGYYRPILCRLRFGQLLCFFSGCYSSCEVALCGIKQRPMCREKRGSREPVHFAGLRRRFNRLLSFTRLNIGGSEYIPSCGIVRL